MEKDTVYSDYAGIPAAPSLVGSSVRDSFDTIPTLKSLDQVKKPVIKDNDSTTELLSVDDARAEGVLIADEEDQLNDILDASGNIKENAIPDVVKLKPKAEATHAPVNTKLLHELSTKDETSDSASLKLLGGAAEQYVVPASGASSGYRHSSKHRKGSDFLPKETEYIDPEQVRSVDDIINVVNKGEFEQASTLVDHKVAETIAGTKKMTLEQLKTLNDDVLQKNGDSDYTGPASMLSREDSFALEEIQSRSASAARPNLASQDSFSRPNLARGESIHSGLNCDLAMNSAYDPKAKALVSERRPRHDPSNLSCGITNSSSMNYLRSISRSRSRAPNDRKSKQEERLESSDLRQNGALINDDELSNAPDIEYAVNKALDFVEGTHTVKNGSKLSENDDIVKNLQRGLAEVAEEEGLTDTGSNRTRMSAFDALESTLGQEDDLMKELMGNDDEEEEEEEDDEVKEDLEEKKEDVTEIEDVTETEDAKSEKKEEIVDVEQQPQAKKEFEENPIIAEEEKKENIKDEIAEDQTKSLEGKKDIEECQAGATVIISKAARSEDLEDKEEEVANNVTEESVDKTTLEEEPKEAVEEVTAAAEAEKGKETDVSGEHTSPLGSLHATESSKTEEEENEEEKEDDIDALIAGAAREKALKESHSGMGNDGSVYVPKVSKMTFEDEPVYLYTSFAGGFHVTTRTNRLETILTANRIKYQYRDLGTDEEAKKVWRRYSNGKTLPGIVRGKDDYIGNWEDIEEANEDYRVRSLIYETY